VFPNKTKKTVEDIRIDERRSGLGEEKRMFYDQEVDGLRMLSREVWLMK
jgi:hypothetical protein